MPQMTMSENGSFGSPVDKGYLRASDAHHGLRPCPKLLKSDARYFRRFTDDVAEFRDCIELGRLVLYH